MTYLRLETQNHTVVPLGTFVVGASMAVADPVYVRRNAAGVVVALACVFCPADEDDSDRDDPTEEDE